MVCIHSFGGRLFNLAGNNSFDALIDCEERTGKGTIRQRSWDSWNNICSQSAFCSTCKRLSGEEIILAS